MCTCISISTKYIVIDIINTPYHGSKFDFISNAHDRALNFAMFLFHPKASWL